MRDPLIFWFDQPPKVSLGAYNYVAQNWGAEVIYVVDHQLGDHRKLINWNHTDYGKSKIIMLSEAEDENQTIREIFSAYPNALHIMNGFVSVIESKIRQYVQKDGIKLAVTTEKPLGSRRSFTFEKWIRNRITPIKYKRIYRQYRNYVNLVLPLGVWGKQLFESYGWPGDKVFSYMYCPVLQDTSPKAELAHEGVVRFLCVGRLNYKARGLDVLMKAFSQLEFDNWNLDIVGGYGEKKEEVKEWADQQEHVSFLGPWPADEVGKRMQDYDVYISPSKADGWQAQINEALNAGMGVIVTDEAVSDELITASGAGVVIRAADTKALQREVKKVLTQPALVKEWKRKAIQYRQYIRGEVVGQYLIDILVYSFYHRDKKPQCPWLHPNQI